MAMDVDGILYDLAHAEGLPRDALQAATEHRGTLVPIFIQKFDSYIAGQRDGDQTLFFAFYLLGQWRETAAYRTLCRFMQLDRDDIDAILGFSGVTENGHRIVAAIFDGDPAPLYEVVYDEKSDEFARAMMCIALAMVTARGQLPRDEMERFLREAFDKLQPRVDNYVWSGWQEAVARLGFSDLQPLVEKAFKRDSIRREWLSFNDFKEDLEQALANDCADIAGKDPRYSLFGDAVTEFSTWYGFSEKYLRERAEAKQRAALDALKPVLPRNEPADADGPFIGVSRKALCPCGSGRKFKHCHGR